MTCGIYEIWCGPYFYQGSSKNIERRLSTHKYELNAGKHDNPKFQNVFNKHGWGSAHVLVECDEDSLTAWEQAYIDANWDDEKFINLSASAYRVVHTPSDRDWETR